MSFELFAESVVKSPGDKRPRRGRGFSIEEVKKADLTIDEARRMGLIVDIRRKSSYDENVEILKQYVKDIEEFMDVYEGETTTEPSISAKIIKELSSIKAVNKEDAELLAKAGISSIEDLAYCEIPKVANKTGIDEERVTEMVKAALKKA
ncbi:MAG: hypothetical protein BAJATHORv1_10376 [Candidatus Thorarchaeota archaeon]|nr:MAG: hypothetical protein BAJATHORv1_10376 [Candidatus Thorarchaeota archaeon]